MNPQERLQAAVSQIEGRENRRQFLKAVGAATAFSVSGCIANEEPKHEDGTRQAAFGQPNADEQTPSPTPTEPFQQVTSPDETRTVPPTDTATATSTPTPSTSPTPQTICTKIQEDSVSIKRGGLPIQRASSVPAEGKTQGLTDDEYYEYDTKRSETFDEGRSEIHVMGTVDGTGSMAMNGAANFSSLWEAPASGEYEVTAEYQSRGGYECDPPDNADHDYTLCSGAAIAAVRNCEQVVASETQADLRIGNNGLAETAAESLLERLAYWVVAPYLGLVGRIIARVIVEWAIDLELKRDLSGRFPGDMLETHTLSTTFPATEGQVFNLQFTPSTGFAAESKIDWIMISEIRSTYILESLQIEPV